jgi:hypothetical protein
VEPVPAEPAAAEADPPEAVAALPEGYLPLL